MRGRDQVSCFRPIRRAGRGPGALPPRVKEPELYLRNVSSVMVGLLPLLVGQGPSGRQSWSYPPVHRHEFAASESIAPLPPWKALYSVLVHRVYGFAAGFLPTVLTLRLPLVCSSARYSLQRTLTPYALSHVRRTNISLPLRRRGNFVQRWAQSPAHSSVQFSGSIATRVPCEVAAG
jgi:hypothetical protein